MQRQVEHDTIVMPGTGYCNSTGPFTDPL